MNLRPHRPWWVRLPASLWPLVLAAACGTTEPARFYVLTPVAANTGMRVEDAPDGPSLQIGPVTIPEYVDRPQIVTHGGGPVIELAEYDRWAEPLRQNLTRVLIENLAQRLATERVIAFADRGMQPADFVVTVAVVALDGVLGETVTLTARWTVAARSGVPISRKSIITKPAGPGRDFAALVAAASAAVAELSDQIAMAIRG